MEAQYKADLQRVLDQRRPKRLLCLGAPCAALFGDYLQADPERTLLELDREAVDRQLAASGQFDLAVVVDTLEHVDKARALHLLAQLRDLHGGHVAVLLPLGGRSGHASRWDANELLAMGMLQLGHYTDATGDSGLFGFDIDQYKTTPDWYNARFWANPERWDKDFW